MGGRAELNPEKRTRLMHTPTQTNWIEWLRAVGDLWRLVAAVGAMLALWLLRDGLVRCISQISSIRIKTSGGILRVLTSHSAKRSTRNATDYGEKY